MNDTDTYQIKLRGQVDLMDLNRTSPVAVTVERIDPGETTLTVRTDQSGLFGLARHLHSRGLVFLSVSRERVENWRSLYLLASAAVVLQMAAILGIIITSLTLPIPTSVEEAFQFIQANRLSAYVGNEFLSLVIVALYLGVFPGLYAALRRTSPAFSALAAVMTMMALPLCFATNSTFAMVHLSDLHAAAGAAGAAERAQLLAAGEAVLAGNMWNSSGAYMAGILLQGGGLLISAVMLRSRAFSRVTAWAGILANGLDLFQHLLHPFAPALAGAVAPLVGLIYLVWLPALARDLNRLARGSQAASASAGLSPRPNEYNS